MIDLTLAMAETAVKAAQAKAKALGASMTVTVVDEAGRLVLSARGDGTGFLTPETSRAKAMTASTPPNCEPSQSSSRISRISWLRERPRSAPTRGSCNGASAKSRRSRMGASQ